jgi:hypothetical protein
MNQPCYILLVLIFALANCKETPASSAELSLEITSQSKSSAKDMSYSYVKSTWDTIISAIQEGNRRDFESLSLDSITACGKSMTSDRFFEKCSRELVNDLLLTKIKDTSKIMINNREVIAKYYSEPFRSRLKEYDRTFFIKRVQIDLIDIEPYVIAFDFIETNDGFRLFSCDVYGGPDCCR